MTVATGSEVERKSGRRAGRSGSPTRPAVERGTVGPAASILVALALAVAGAAVFRGSLGYFFTQDDFSGLARAHGLLPRLSGPWRYLSGQTYFDAMAVLAGLNPVPYHLASLGAHLATAVLLFAWVRRWTGAPAAMLGAACFATHPAVYQAVYSISGIGEILALLFALAAWMAARRGDRWAFGAIPLFAASLLCKETTVLLPAALAVERWSTLPRAARERRAPGARDAAGVSPSPGPGWPVVLGLAAVAVVYLGFFLALDAFAVRGALSERAPYSLAFGETWLRNLLTYLGWTVNLFAFSVRSFSDAIDPGVFPWGVVLLLAGAAGAFVPALRRRGFLVGIALFACCIAPVLPLRNHTYHYYLYAPLAGAALCLAAAADALAARFRTPGAAWAAAAALGALLAINGATLVRKIESYPFIHPALRADPTVDRARIAGNVIADLRAAQPAPGTRLLFVSPISAELARAAGRDPAAESYFETNVRGALVDGLAVRLFFPGVGVEFLRAPRPLAPGELYAVYLPDGHLRVADQAAFAELLRTMPRANP
jgi:hypothetical protein